MVRPVAGPAGVKRALNSPTPPGWHSDVWRCRRPAANSRQPGGNLGPAQNALPALSPRCECARHARSLSAGRLPGATPPGAAQTAGVRVHLDTGYDRKRTAPSPFRRLPQGAERSQKLPGQRQFATTCFDPLTVLSRTRRHCRCGEDRTGYARACQHLLLFNRKTVQ